MENQKCEHDWYNQVAIRCRILAAKQEGIRIGFEKAIEIVKNNSDEYEEQIQRILGDLKSALDGEKK